MKKIFLVFIIISTFVTSFAQELSEGLTAKNDGNEAYRNKDFVSAIVNWEKYLKSSEEGVATDENTKSLYVLSFKYAAGDFMKAKDYKSAYTYYEKFIEKEGASAKKDGDIAYRMAYCANKMDQNDLALSQYQHCLELGYKGDMCMLYMADIYKDADHEEKMITVLKEALVKYPTSKNRSKMASMLVVPMLKEAALPFNEANELAKAASSSEPSEYLRNMAQAVAKFEEAIPLFKTVLEYDPSNDQANTYINACQDNIKSYNTYRDSLDK